MIEDAPVKPRVIRFFRNAMFNMISLALKDLKVRVLPSRSTNALYSWLDQRCVPFSFLLIHVNGTAASLP